MSNYSLRKNNTDPEKQSVLSEQEKLLSLAVMSVVMNGYDSPGMSAETQRYLQQHGLAVLPDSQATVVTFDIQGTYLLPPETVVPVNMILRRSYPCGSFVMGRTIHALLFSRNGFAELHALLKEVKKELEESFGESCRIGVGSFSDAPVSLLNICFEAYTAVRYDSGSGITFMEDIREKVNRLSGEEQLATDLDRLLVYGRRSELRDFLITHLDTSVGEIDVLQILSTAVTVFRLGLGEKETERLLRRYDLLNPLSSGRSAVALRHNILDFSLEGSDLISKRKQNDMKLLVERVIDIINHRYMDPELTLKRLSGYLNVTPNYLSAQIRKYKDVSFMDILTGKRMEAAAELLRTTDLKVAEIAERCGYNDPHYFSYCYKKHYRESPLDTRRQVSE
ncbi:MAG: helix-turn-helix transcriptional regulator [Erysipelotrichaceae bacterium]|nr:helix-turn-helix transcriptional regulator [Erysipelotrichaceae bacterium]